MSKQKSVSLAPHLGFLYRIGQCSRCMRQSFIVAAVAVFALVVVLAVGSTSVSWALPLAEALAVAAVGLWILHLVVFGRRAVRASSVARSADAGEVAVGEDGAAPVRRAAPESRRRVLRLFAEAVAGAALSTALPSVALAFNECPGQMTCPMSSCNNGDVYCCPPGYPVLNLCNCRCYQSAYGVQQAGCRSTGSCYNENF